MRAGILRKIYCSHRIVFLKANRTYTYYLEEIRVYENYIHTGCWKRVID
jgi:hypothetical protein